jgi:probable HAF family extracellular repeat protein
MVSLPTYGSEDGAVAVSLDGSVVCGYTNEHDIRQTFRWTQAGGRILIGGLGGSYDEPLGMSGDGTTIVGNAQLPNFDIRAFRWTLGGGTQNLGVLPEATESYAEGVSLDGQVVIGSSGYGAFRWTSAAGMEDLGLLPGANGAGALATNADGSVIVGQCGIANEPHVFRWTRSGGMVDLGRLPGATRATVSAVSADGNVVVGSSGFSDQFATFWTPELGLVNLPAYLRSHGINLGTWELENATAVSADGHTIVGTGRVNGRMNETWWVSLVPICYADCDRSGPPPALNINDFVCFMDRFAAGDPFANCDGSTGIYILDVNDFICFTAHFAAGCP